MRPPQPLPAEPPFLTLLTTAFRRPAALARNFASVARQTAVARVEQIVLPDHVGYGWAALFGRAAWYAEAVRGRYVAWLNDDDALVGERAVQALMAEAAREPEALIVRVLKGGVEFPRGNPHAAPVEGEVDLGSYVLRRDVWVRHAGDYGDRYQGDFDHAAALWAAGVRPVVTGLLFAEGPAGGGRPEVDW